MKFSFRSVAILGCIFAGMSGAMPAQRTSTGDFDSLARRASAALGTDPKQGVKLYKQALALKPEWAEGWFDLGGGLYQIDQFSGSGEGFSEGGDAGTGKWRRLGLSGIVRIPDGQLRCGADGHS